ncbi:hypothetical protein M5689_017366 [Euphorbia peplus]|nr:hypothetical protein M5689_017366 [Euphorbia peplus]
MPSRGSVTLQKKIVRRPLKPENVAIPVPDLTDFMNDMFFGTATNEKKAYNLNGSRFDNQDELEDEDESFDSSTRSNSSRLTQEWLEEAKKMMSSSPTRCDSPSRLVGSPRFAAAPGKLSAVPNSVLDKRDPLSRSARRHRGVEGFSGEILIKSAKHTRNKSETLDESIPPLSPSEPSPANQVQQWLNSNILKPFSDPNDPPSPSALPPRQSAFRKSRFQTAPTSVPSRRTFKTAPLPDNDVLSPPKNLIESAQRRSSISSSQAEALSPPRNLVESAYRRSISRSTCAVDKIAPKDNNVKVKTEEQKGSKEVEAEGGGVSLNRFLKEQRMKIEKILSGEIHSKAKVILSGPSNSTSSMIAAICYAWLLQNKDKGDNGYVVVPVMNIRRSKMWKQRQAAWLFHHLGLDATSLLFADEVDLESLIMEGKLSILVIGQDVLKTNNEVESQCAILTDNYCEDAYHLLQTPFLKKLLLSGILLDTQNLNASVKMPMTRDSEAVQLLLVGSPSTYQHDLFRQLMQDQKDKSFFEALRHNYGKPPSDGGVESVSNREQKGAERKSTSVSRNEQTMIQQKDLKNGTTTKDSPKPPGQPAASTPEASRGKNKFFLAKWFGFGK